MPKVKIERKTDWSVRLATYEDKANAIDFFTKTTWKDRPAKLLYEWKYERNPQGNSLVLIGTNSEDMIIAANAFMPWRLNLNNNIIKAGQWVDMIIDLAYRGQNMPAKMLETGRNTFRQEGAKVHFAFPNENGVLVHKENNGFCLGNISRYVKPLRTRYLVDRFIKQQALAKVISFFLDIGLRIFSKENFLVNTRKFGFEKVDRISNIDKFDEFWQRVSKKHAGKIMTQRDSVYINWKFINTPNRNRFLLLLKKGDDIYGFAAVEISENTGYIVDIFAIDESALARIIAYSLLCFKKKGMDSAVFVALENNMYVDLFKKLGFVERLDKKRFYIYVDDDIDNKNYYLDLKNWYITIGDCDIEKL